MVKVSNNDICNILYSIRDCVNEGDFKSGIELVNLLRATMVVAGVESNKCEVSCDKCKGGNNGRI